MQGWPKSVDVNKDIHQQSGQGDKGDGSVGQTTCLASMRTSLHTHHLWKNLAWIRLQSQRNFCASR